MQRGRDSMDSLLFGVDEQEESSVPDSVLKSLLLQVDICISFQTGVKTLYEGILGTS